MIPTNTRDAAAIAWRDKYSNAGDFEEFGQHEAFKAGQADERERAKVLFDALMKIAEPNDYEWQCLEALKALIAYEKGES